jgi:hypothetical protein
MKAKECSEALKIYKDTKIKEIIDPLTNKKYLESTIYIPIDNEINVLDKQEIKYYSAYVKECYNKTLSTIGLVSLMNQSYFRCTFYSEIILFVTPMAFFSSIIVFKRAKASKLSKTNIFVRLSLVSLGFFGVLLGLLGQYNTELDNFLTYEALKPNTYEEISQYRLFKDNKGYSKI